MSKIKTLAIDIGHNVSNDGGAYGIFLEDTLNLQVGTRLLQRLKTTNLKVINCTPLLAYSLTHSLKQRCDIANNGKADFFLSIHHNACPGGYGSEALCIKGGNAEGLGNVILSKLTTLNLKNRGIKDGSNLYVIKNTIMEALLVECAFVDSYEDMKNYNPIAVADLIFDSLVQYFDLNINDPSITNSKVYYTVVPGDTLWAISRKFNTTVEEIVRLNEIKNKNLIFPGEKILIK